MYVSAFPDAVKTISSPKQRVSSASSDTIVINGNGFTTICIVSKSWQPVEVIVAVTI